MGHGLKVAQIAGPQEFGRGVRYCAVRREGSLVGVLPGSRAGCRGGGATLQLRWSDRKAGEGRKLQGDPRKPSRESTSCRKTSGLGCLPSFVCARPGGLSVTVTQRFAAPGPRLPASAAGARHAMYLADEAVIVTNPEVSSCRDSDKMVGFIGSKSRRAETGDAPVRQTLLVTRYGERVTAGAFS